MGLIRSVLIFIIQLFGCQQGHVKSHITLKRKKRLHVGMKIQEKARYLHVDEERHGDYSINNIHECPSSLSI